MRFSLEDERHMALALREAKKAFQYGEVPVGAVVVKDGQVIGRGYNRVEGRQDALQHAEMIALRQAASRMGQWRLQGCQLYVTLEPCAMCAGAITWARIQRVVYAAKDPKAGACGSALRVLGHPRLNHRPQIQNGLLQEESSVLLKIFFRQIRQVKR